MTRSRRDTLAHVHDLAVAAMVEAGGRQPAPGGWRQPVPLRPDRDDGVFTAWELRKLAGVSDRVRAQLRVLFSHLAASPAPSPAGDLAGGCSATSRVEGFEVQTGVGQAAGSLPSGRAALTGDRTTTKRRARAALPVHSRVCVRRRKFDRF